MALGNVSRSRPLPNIIPFKITVAGATEQESTPPKGQVTPRGRRITSREPSPKLLCAQVEQNQSGGFTPSPLFEKNANAYKIHGISLFCETRGRLITSRKPFLKQLCARLEQNQSGGFTPSPFVGKYGNAYKIHCISHFCES